MIATLRALAGACNFVPGWAWAGICAGLIATNCTTGIKLERSRAAAAQAQAAHAQTVAANASAAQAAEAAARQREQAAAQALATIEQKAQDEKADLRRRVAALTDGLRNRPERPASGGAVPAGAADPVGCTGASLYRSDGEFLAGEAARADELRTDLATCRAAYDAAVKLTN